MDRSLTRRSLLAASASIAVAPMARAFPEFMIRGEVKPVVISASNGNIFKNGGTETCVQKSVSLDDGRHRCFGRSDRGSQHS